MQKKSNLKVYCFSKSSAVASGNQADVAVFLGTTRQLCGSLMAKEFFDTGAEVSAVSEETYQKVHGKQLHRPTKVYQSLKQYNPYKETVFVI